MGVTATLNGATVTDAHVQIPAWGAAIHDVGLDSAVTLSGKVTLQVADLALSCAVLSGGPAYGRSFYRVVAGAGGWGKSLAAKGYANDAGVKLATVLSDAATAVGETLDTTTIDPTARLGPAFTRPAGPAGRLLELLAPGAWYVGEDGKTRLGARPPGALPAAAIQTTQLDLARGTVTLASETIASILPGLVYQGLTAVDVEHTYDSGGLRSKLWAKQGTGTSRRLAALRAIVDQLFPDLAFRGVYEFRIGAQNGNRYDLQPVRVSTGMPTLQRVPMRPGVPGANGKPALGSRVVVGFLDANPARPVVLAFDEPDSPSFLPISVSLAGGGAAIGRVGDDVKVTNLTITAPSGGGPCTISQVAPGGTDVTGSITSGSPKVTSG